MTNKEIIEEARAVKEMNEREAERARISSEEIAVQQRANELVLRIGNMGDNELMSPIFREALMNERRIAIEETREACAKIGDEEAGYHAGEMERLKRNDLAVTIEEKAMNVAKRIARRIRALSL